MQPQTSMSGAPHRAASSGVRLTLLLALCLFAVQLSEAQTYSVLYAFTGNGDGESPLAGALRDAEGNLYGTTMHGGAFDYGTVFRMDPGGKETVLHSFTGGDGQWPIANLIRDEAGNLYGTTDDGGTSEGGSCHHGCGTVFRVDKTGKETVVHAFTGGADGGYPSGLIQDKAGNIYGTAGGGNTSCTGGCGVVFKLDKAGKETVLYTFTGAADGNAPASLIRDEQGNLYGVAGGGGNG
jgi:uncharacterized repeat protein (TIGR03803 family)